jgi:hypothetical protein
LARRSADERYDPLKLGGAKLWRDLIDAAVMEQEDSRDHVFGYALGGGPDLFLRMKLETNWFVMGRKIYRLRTAGPGTAGRRQANVTSADRPGTTRSR